LCGEVGDESIPPTEFVPEECNFSPELGHKFLIERVNIGEFMGVVMLMRWRGGPHVARCR
jgi:hypothetical protein